MRNIARKICAEFVRIAGVPVYTGWTKNTFGEYVVSFRIDGIKYEYYMTYKDKGIIEWMFTKKRLDDGVVLNYAKKNAYEVWKNGEKLQSEKNVIKAFSNIQTLDGSNIRNCSGWYVPKNQCIMIFKHGGHRVFMDEYFNPFDDKFKIGNKQVLNAIMDARKKLVARMQDGIDYDDLWNCGWIRFNMSPGYSTVSTSWDNYDDVMDLLNILGPYIKQEVMVQMGGGKTAMFRMSELDSREDLVKKFWMSKAANKKDSYRIYGELRDYSKLMTMMREYSNILEILIGKLFNLVPDVNNGIIGNIMDIDICAVNGNEVKKDTYMDFVEGGNDKVYDFIPDKTIWIDNSIVKSQWKYIILHEMVERWLMDNMNYKYNDAHKIANMFENEFRKKE